LPLPFLRAHYPARFPLKAPDNRGGADDQGMRGSSGRRGLWHESGDPDWPFHCEAPTVQLDPFDLVERLRSKVSFLTMRAGHQGDILDDEEVLPSAIGLHNPPNPRPLLSADLGHHQVSPSSGRIYRDDNQATARTQLRAITSPSTPSLVLPLMRYFSSPVSGSRWRSRMRPARGTT